MIISYFQVLLDVQLSQAVVCVRVDLQRFGVEDHLHRDEVCENPLARGKTIVGVKNPQETHAHAGRTSNATQKGPQTIIRLTKLTWMSSSFCLWKSVMASSSCRTLCWALLEAFCALTSACESRDNTVRRAQPRRKQTSDYLLNKPETEGAQSRKCRACFVAEHIMLC